MSLTINLVCPTRACLTPASVCLTLAQVSLKSVQHKCMSFLCGCATRRASCSACACLAVAWACLTHASVYITLVYSWMCVLKHASVCPALTCACLTLTNTGVRAARATLQLVSHSAARARPPPRLLPLLRLARPGPPRTPTLYHLTTYPCPQLGGNAWWPCSDL